MRKDRFIKAFAQYLPMLRPVALHHGVDYDTASEIVAKCFERMLKTKKYKIIEPEKLKSFLSNRIRREVQMHLRSEATLKMDCARLPDLDATHTADSKIHIANQIALEPITETECPFCFHANLNEHGACHMCHTIVPSHRRVQRDVVFMTEESLAVEFDFNTKIDVQNAIARLTPFEQRVVRAVGLGNESLESFALDLAVNKTYLVRTWLKAKAKLQGYLIEYAPNRLSKRGESAFRKAVQSVEITH